MDVNVHSIPHQVRNDEASVTPRLTRGASALCYVRNDDFYANESSNKIKHAQIFQMSWSIYNQNCRT